MTNWTTLDGQMRRYSPFLRDVEGGVKSCLLVSSRCTLPQGSGARDRMRRRSPSRGAGRRSTGLVHLSEKPREVRMTLESSES